MIMIDPKRLELGLYQDIPHLLVPVVTEPKIAQNALKWAVSEMETRYKKLAKRGVRNLEAYNEQVKQLPIPGLNDQAWMKKIANRCLTSSSSSMNSPT